MRITPFPPDLPPCSLLSSCHASAPSSSPSIAPAPFPSSSPLLPLLQPLILALLLPLSFPLFHPLFTLSLHSLYPLFSLSLPPLYPLFTLSLPSLYPLFTLCLLSLFTFFLPSLYPLFTLSLPFMHLLSTFYLPSLCALFVLQVTPFLFVFVLLLFGFGNVFIFTQGLMCLSDASRPPSCLHRALVFVAQRRLMEGKLKKKQQQGKRLIVSDNEPGNRPETASFTNHSERPKIISRHLKTKTAQDKQNRLSVIWERITYYGHSQVVLHSLYVDPAPTAPEFSAYPKR